MSGVGPGLGRSLALAFARHGADVVVAARRPESLAPVVAEVEALGRRVLAVPTDVTDPAAVEALVEATGRTFGRLDVLVNNAFSMSRFESADQLTADDWRVAFDVNVVGSVSLTMAAADLLEASGQGAVVMIGSQAARRSEPRRGPYAASKAALVSAARTLAGELGPRGIRVNTVVPGHIWGDALEQFFAATAARKGSTPEAVYESVARGTALRRIPDADEIADAAVFLGSPLARAVTGQTLDVNAGSWFE
ncbi:MAG: short-chain dehydrogenase [Actinomycetia bacterium]|nr:short-chain dehydrogenase [Actinomycetes bacterium]